MEVVRVQRAGGVTVRVGLRAISASSANHNNWRLRTNGSRRYLVGAGKIQEVRTDNETAVAWLSTWNDNEQEREGYFVRRKRHEHELAKHAALLGVRRK